MNCVDHVNVKELFLLLPRIVFLGQRSPAPPEQSVKKAKRDRESARVVNLVFSFLVPAARANVFKVFPSHQFRSI
jgi:hypothetical protein